MKKTIKNIIATFGFGVLFYIGWKLSGLINMSEILKDTSIEVWIRFLCTWAFATLIAFIIYKLSKRHEKNNRQVVY